MISYGKSLQQMHAKWSGLGAALAWMLEMLVLAFRVRLRAPSKATEAWLDKDRKTGAAGFWICLAVVTQALRPNEAACSENDVVNSKCC